MKFKYIVTTLLGIVFTLSALYAVVLQEGDHRQTKADVIMIDSMKTFGELERTGVSFSHDKHTNALEKQGKDCASCHQTSNNKLVHKFKRTKEVDYETSLDIYHTNCIGCHEENAGEASGPVECGECHQQEPDVIPGQQLIAFDASIHQRHIQAADNKCNSCHHGYDATEQKIAYKKGQEDSCRTCHKDKLQDKVISYKSASHNQCISCHQQENVKKEIKNTLVAQSKCAGCHDGDELKKIAKLNKIARLNRNQPNTTFVKSFDDMTRDMMDPVIFNHQQHEDNTASCSTCHHETLNSCESCHTLSGSKEGNWITLAQAMHDTDSDRSCIGCHAKEQNDKACSGCHSLMKKDKHAGEKSCRSCHSVPIDRIKAHKRSGRKLQARNYRTSVQTTRIDYKKLPKNVVIDVVSKEYKGVSFPHKLIIESMMGKMKGNVLAAKFHQGKNSVCESCHHNSPNMTDPPPKCISCHASSDSEQDGTIPGIKAAYHRQCFECHEEMEIKKPVSTDCTGCHQEK